MRYIVNQPNTVASINILHNVISYSYRPTNRCCIKLIQVQTDEFNMQCYN